MVQPCLPQLTGRVTGQHLQLSHSVHAQVLTFMLRLCLYLLHQVALFSCSIMQLHLRAVVV